MKLLLLLSGPVAAGKSSVASELIQAHRFQSIRTGKYLAELARRKRIEISRTALQQLGDDLDQQTDYRWVLDDVASPAILDRVEVERWLFDSVRKQRQIEHFRSRYGSRVFHVHLTAPETLLQRRYDERLVSGHEHSGSTPYRLAIAHPNEVSARCLIEYADVVVDVTEKSNKEAAKVIVTHVKSRNL